MNKENLALIKRRANLKKFDLRHQDSSDSISIPTSVFPPPHQSSNEGVIQSTAFKNNLALLHVKPPRRPSFEPSTDLHQMKEQFKAQFHNPDEGKMKRLEEASVFTAPRPRILWRCTCCKQHCIPVRRESRCLCGHRLKEHSSPSSVDSPFRCEAKSCVCQHFKFIVAEGAWILKCRCKHKHTEHDCSKPPFVCKKCPGSSCNGFDSPWVCNCGHGFAAHEQLTVLRSEQEMGALLQDVYSGSCSAVAATTDTHTDKYTDKRTQRTFAVRQDGLLAKELQEDAERHAL